MSDLQRQPSGFQQGVAARLAQAGRSAEGVAALLALDADLFHWHRAAAKGEGVARLLEDLGLGIDLAAFAALTAVTRIAQGIGRAEPSPPTIGALADELGLDPSRASRLAGQLIAQGLLQRQVAQQDGRITILVLTDQARDTMAAFRDLKWSRYIDVFADWPDADIAAFSRLFRRYMDGMRRAYAPGERVSD